MPKKFIVFNAVDVSDTFISCFFFFSGGRGGRRGHEDLFFWVLLGTGAKGMERGPQHDGEEAEDEAKGLWST